MLLQGTINTALPAGDVDGTLANARLSKYGEPMIHPLGTGLTAIADNGNYFKATNATFGTGIAATSSSAWSATQALVLIRNADTDPLNGKRIYLDYIKLTVVTPATSGVVTQFAFSLDPRDRSSSGGTVLTATNSNLDAGVGSIAEVRVGAVTVTGNAGLYTRLAARFSGKSTAPVAGDTILLNFGSLDSPGQVTGAAGAVPIAPVILGPAGQQVHSFVLHHWITSSTAAATYEYEIGWWER